MHLFHAQNSLKMGANPFLSQATREFHHYFVPPHSGRMEIVMAKLKIVKHGDETLRKVCRPVEKITPRIITLLDDMLETMHAADGVGLAAPQVGVLRRIAIVEVEEGEVYELINPRIVAFAGEQEEQEGCLSIPGRWGITKRPKHVTVRAFNRKGEEYEV